MVITVWVQLLRGGENIGRADQIKLEDGSNVADLCDAVKVKFSNQLQTYDAAQLNVSTARESSEYLELDQTLNGLQTSPRAPLFVHVPALAGGSEQATLRAVKRSKTDADGRFFATITEPSRPSDSVLLFQARIITTTDQKFFFVRPCYDPLYRRLWTELTSSPIAHGARPAWDDKDGADISAQNHKRAYAGAIVTGTKGIGKTFMGLEVLRRLVTEKMCPVLYNFRNKKHFLVTPPLDGLRRLPNGDPRKELLKLNEFQGAGSDELPGHSCWWGQIDLDTAGGRELYTNLKNLRALWLLVDLHAEAYEDLHPPCHVVIFASLRSDRFKSFTSGGDGNTITLCMPPWSWEEVKLCKEASEEHTKEFVQVSEDDLRNRFEQFGGSARFLFCQLNYANAELQKAISKAVCSENDLVQALQPEGTHPSISSTLVHMFPGEDFEEKTVQFASERIRNELVGQLLERRALTEQIWLNATRGLSIDRAFQFEMQWHFCLQNPRGRSIRLKYLGSGCDAQGQQTKNGSSARKVKLKFKQSESTLSLFDNDITNVKEIKVGQYLKPKLKNFPGIDALAVYRGPLWDPEEGDEGDEVAQGDDVLSLTMWQMTITADNDHGTKGHVLKTVIQHVEGLLGVSVNAIYLLYAVENIDKFTFQRYVKDDGKAFQDAREFRPHLERIQQYAVALPQGTHC